ncbi:CGNR zinc finger domain-containing protein [Kineococcus rhizosphaerae]|uniref:Putative RNA-binding Zn ribbon-like protein n=1 Tax=Kineococcus rhizosphaerae TaxID=559628 RepID=A0A2T0R698_9ACTN|nr:CGNR zinc finger domain-containing protein [Kineococcus rhizosphaerae]PRY16683.1 putative RNA-binding Zn ribbon-like protein [Kineococcus rhizosphaerae]
MRTAGDLDLVRDFLNTLDERRFTRHGQEHSATDELVSGEALSAWWREHDLAGSAPDGAEPDAAELGAVLRLRTALREALLGAGPAAGQDALAGFPVRLAPDGSGRLRLAAATGSPGLDVLVETVATAVASGRWSRLKLCAAPECRWAFHDTSRSGAGRWCSMQVCGNRHKTAAYRRRATA